MRLDLTTLINFNGDQGFRQNSAKVPLNHEDIYPLINPWILFAHLKNFSDNREANIQEYHQDLMPVTLSFTNLSFRHQYYNWIYSKYSKSTTNFRRIQRNERAILLKWARQFNHYHHHLKIIQIEPIVNNNHLMAKFQLIGFNLQFGQLSFNFRIALENEYQQDYDQAFIHLENDVGNQLANILKIDFDQYFPEANFTFINQKIDQRKIERLKPVKFNPKWISHQQQKSAAKSRSRFNQLQKTYNSVLSSANVRSVSDSQMIAKLKSCLQSTSNEQNSLATTNSQRVSKLSSQQSKLSMFQSQAVSYSSIASQASNQAADLSNQSNASAIAAKSVQMSLRSNIASQSTINQQLNSQVKSLDSVNNQSRTSLRNSLINQLSSVQSQATDYSLIATKINSQSQASLKTANSIQDSLHSDIVSQLTANHQLSSQVNSLSIKLSQANSLSNISIHNASVVSTLKSQMSSVSTSASSVRNQFNSQSNLNQNLITSGSESTANQHSVSNSNDIIFSIVSSSNQTSSVKYAKDYNFALNNKSLSAANSLTFSQPVKVNKNFQSIYGSSKKTQSNHISSGPRVRWEVKREPNYIPIIMAIVIIIIGLLIIALTLLRF